MRPAASNPRSLVWPALLTVYVVWGSTYLAIRYLVQSAPPFLSAGARFVVAGALLAGVVAARRGTAALRVSSRQLWAAMLVGTLLLLGGNGLIMLAERRIDSHLAALVVAAVPLFVVVLRLLSRERVAASAVAGVLGGFVGLALLVDPRTGNTTGLLVVLGAAATWSVGSWLSGRIELPADPLVSAVYEMVLGGAALLVASALRGEWHGFTVNEVTGASWAAFAYLVVFGSLVAFTSYVWLLQNAPLSTVATYAYVNPVVAVVLGAVAGEALGWRALAGGSVVVAAVAAVVSAEARGRRRHAPDTGPIARAPTGSHPTS